MMCMCTTICLKQINGCVEPIICATLCIYDLMDEFFVWWPLLLLLYQIYMLFGLLSKNFMKKSKNINLGGGGGFESRAGRSVYR
jgi:hypothetical protein